MLTVTAVRLAELYPFESLVDDLSSYLQSQLGAIVEYAEKYGVNIPISDDLAVNELLENGPPETDHDELSLLLQSATSDLVSNGAENPGDTDPGSNMNGDSASLTDSLGLGKLIQDSLLTQHGSTKEGLPDNTATNGVEPFDSEGLASLIASKLNNAQGSVSNGGPSFSSQPYHPTLPPSSSGKYCLHSLHVSKSNADMRSRGPLALPSSTQPTLSNTVLFIHPTTPAATTTSRRARDTSTEPDFPHVNIVRASSAGSCRQVVVHCAPRGTPFHPQSVDS